MSYQHLTAFNGAHIQHVINQRQQMVGCTVDFMKTVVDSLLIPTVLDGNPGHSDNAVNRGSNIMRHMGQEFAFGSIGGSCLLCRLLQKLVVLLLLGKHFPVIFIGHDYDDQNRKNQNCRCHNSNEIQNNGVHKLCGLDSKHLGWYKQKHRPL